MRQLVCEDCQTIHYSASAAKLAEEGACCEVCGGYLELRVQEEAPEMEPGRLARPG